MSNFFGTVNSGYHLRRELFYRHFSPICLFAVFGTIISTLVITLILYFATSTLRLSSFQPTFFELLTFGSLISTTDPVTTLAVLQVKRVDPQIFYLVFGESALNDAIGLVLFQQCSKLLGTVSTATDLSQSTTRELAIGFATNFSYCVIGSPIVGIILGIGVAYLFKCIDMRENALLELALYIFLLYVPYLVGEILGLSGIVVVLFSGITAKQYCVPNLSEITNMNSDFIFRLIAFLAETAIFLELGLSIVGLTGYFHFKFILCALLACLVGRAANIYPLTAIHNWTIRRRDGVDRPYSSAPAPVHEETTSLLGTEHPTLVRNISTKTHNKMFYMSEGTPSERGDLKIHSNSAHMLWFAGLRGAVAYACVRNFPDTYGNRDSFTMTTMMVILATTFLLGATTAPVLRLLDIETDVCEDSYMNTWSMQRSLPDYIVKLQNFIQSHVCRASDEDDEVFTTTGNNFQTSNLTSSIRRRSSINVAKSVRWEGAGLYDFGMD